MAKYILKRLAFAAVSLLIITAVIFILMRQMPHLLTLLLMHNRKLGSSKMMKQQFSTVNSPEQNF